MSLSLLIPEGKIKNNNKNPADCLVPGPGSGDDRRAPLPITWQPLGPFPAPGSPWASQGFK